MARSPGRLLSNSPQNRDLPTHVGLEMAPSPVQPSDETAALRATLGKN